MLDRITKVSSSMILNNRCNNNIEPSVDSSEDLQFKLAEKLFIPSSNKANWYSKEYVDELQSFYQRERQTLKDRIDRVYKETDDAKLALISQVESLKSQLAASYESHKEETVSANTLHSKELSRLAGEKDLLIAKLQNQVAELRNELSQLTLKYNDLKDEHRGNKYEYDSHVESLSMQLQTQAEILSSQKQDYEYRADSMKQRYEYDRSELKKEYDRLVQAVREESLKSQNDLCEVVKVKNKEIDSLRKDLTEIKYSFSGRITDLERENKELKDALKSTQKLAEMQMKENK